MCWGVMGDETDNFVRFSMSEQENTENKNWAVFELSVVVRTSVMFEFCAFSVVSKSPCTRVVLLPINQTQSELGELHICLYHAT